VVAGGVSDLQAGRVCVCWIAHHLAGRKDKMAGTTKKLIWLGKIKQELKDQGKEFNPNDFHDMTEEEAEAYYWRLIVGHKKTMEEITAE
jgi:hypothetical protein